MQNDTRRKKTMNQACKEEMAVLELKTQIVKLMFEFIEKYVPDGENCLYPQVGNILVSALTACLSDMQYQIQGISKFTSKQIDHICYQIGDWYLDDEAPF